MVYCLVNKLYVDEKWFFALFDKKIAYNKK